MKFIKFLWNVYKSLKNIKSHQLDELSLIEFDNMGNLKSFTTIEYEIAEKMYIDWANKEYKNGGGI